MKEFKNPAVLYVEDDAASRKILQILLINRLGYENVTLLENSENFETCVLEIEPIPDIVFLDIHVHPLDGFEMLKILRRLKSYENVRIVALTASVMNEEILQLRKAGFDACFSKPIDIDTFPDNMNEILQGKSIWEIV